MATPELSAKEAINAAVRYGYDSVSLRMHEICGELKINSTKEDLHEIRHLFSDNGIIQGALMCYNQMQQSNKETYSHNFEYTLRALEVAAKIGAYSIRLFGDGEHMDAFSEAIHDAMENSGSKIKVLLQNHKGNADCEQIISFSEKVNNTGLIFSPDHIEENRAYDMCEKSIPFMKEVYASNIIGTGDNIKHVPLSQGKYDWIRLYKIISEGGFDGILSIKWERIWHRELADYNYILPLEKKVFG